jgi:predicted signal transduction protein with EAL and GGDEF domain
MNVNLSSRQLVRDIIADEVAAAVDESGIRPSWLVLEVTETVLMADPVAAATALTQIRDLGVRVALDDFGSGYSSLSHLRRFPIDIVKIDKSFVDDVANDGVESAIARSIIDLGRAMKIQTVAEGIEAGEQAERLLDLGCELGQGYFFSRPQDPDTWQQLLARTDETPLAPSLADADLPDGMAAAADARRDTVPAEASREMVPAEGPREMVAAVADSTSHAGRRGHTGSANGRSGAGKPLRSPKLPHPHDTAA